MSSRPTSDLSTPPTAETYLLYRIQGELYATPLSMVREVVPFQTPRTVPNTKRTYLGMMNLRGELIGVADLRLWFKDEKPMVRPLPPRALVVVHSEAGVMGIAADVVEGVFPLDIREIESPKGMPGTFADGGMIGIGKFKQGLATLLDLRALCASVEVATERKERWVS